MQVIFLVVKFNLIWKCHRFCSLLGLSFCPTNSRWGGSS